MCHHCQKLSCLNSPSEVMGLAATLSFEDGSATLSFDGQSAFNSMFRHRFLPALTAVISIAVTYATNPDAGVSTKLIFAMEDGTAAIVGSARGLLKLVDLGGCATEPAAWSGFAPTRQ